METGRRRDIFVSKLHHIELMGGGMARYVLCVTDEGQERILDEAIVMPLDALPDALRKAMIVAGSDVVGKIAKLLPSHMH